MKVFLLLFSLCFCTFCFSQEDKKEKLYYPHYAIGVSPSAIFNFFRGYQISQDVGVHKRINLTLETAYINHSIYSDFTQGYRLKPGIQFLVVSNSTAILSVGVNYNYRRTISPRTSTYFFEFEGYSEEVRYDRIKVLKGLEMTLSTTAKLTDRLRFEIGFGLGLGNFTRRDINSTASRPLNNAFRNFETIFLDAPGKDVIPMGTVNLNFSYILIQ